MITFLTIMNLTIVKPIYSNLLFIIYYLLLQYIVYIVMNIFIVRIMNYC